MSKLRFTVLATSMLTTSMAFSMAAWDNANKPEQFEFNYETKISELPKSGKLSLQPWSGDYWATYKGGISYRWNDKSASKVEKYSYDLIDMDKLTDKEIAKLSPAEKYDLLIGATNYPLTNHERERTGILKTVPGSSEYVQGHKIPTWFGLCHAWAPATIVFNNPSQVEMTAANGKKILFGSSDIKALLTSFVDIDNTTRSKFLGSRCNLDFKKIKEELDSGKITKKQYLDQINSSECKDTNAGAFHIVLTNQIAKMDQGFVVDVTRDAEVWNQAVQGYTSRIKDASGISDEAAAGTVREVIVNTDMYYTVEVHPSMTNEIPSSSVRVANYKYRLELDKNDKIIGGEWLSFKRPDFIWKQKAPKFKGFFSELETLYKKSTAYIANQKDEASKNLLIAAQEGNLSDLNKAIALGANPNFANAQGQTALMLAGKYNNETEVKALISAGADVNLADAKGRTAAITTVIGSNSNVQSNTLDILKALVSAGADTKVKDIEDKTALDYAQSKFKWYRVRIKKVIKFLENL